MTSSVLALPKPIALNLEKSPLSPQTWPFALEWLPETAHLVGGIVRDALLERQPDYLDLDFVLPEGSVETARAIARHYKVGFVVLDAERQIARVVFDTATVDFALQEGEDLEQDLKRRDFTINAIAYSPHAQALVDPVGGYDDLQQRRLRMISRQNLADDPLRLLRAYRQAAQLGFELDKETEMTIGELSDRLSSMAAERVQSELNTLLSSTKGTPWLHRAWETGLLSPWLPSLNHTSMEQLAQLDSLAPLLQECLGELLNIPTSFLKSSLGKQGCLPLAKLVCLSDSVPEIADLQLQQLKYSRLEMRAAATVRRLQPQLQSRSLSIREQYFLFLAAGDLFPVLILVELAAQLQADQQPPTNIAMKPSQGSIQRLEESPLRPLMERYLNPQDPVAHPCSLLTGKTLMEALTLKPGPQVGKLLTELQIAQAEGKVADQAGAIAWLKANQQELLS